MIDTAELKSIMAKHDVTGVQVAKEVLGKCQALACATACLTINYLCK